MGLASQPNPNAASALYTTLASLSGALSRIRRANRAASVGEAAFEAAASLQAQQKDAYLMLAHLDVKMLIESGGHEPTALATGAGCGADRRPCCAPGNHPSTLWSIKPD
jgi:hypothetical protein